MKPAFTTFLAAVALVAAPALDKLAKQHQPAGTGSGSRGK